MRKDRLKSVKVTTNNESQFYDYIKDNFAEYFFFHADYTQYSEDTKIFMALDENNKIHGMLLIWKERRIQLRGSVESLEFLLKDKNFSPISVTGLEEHKKLIAKHFPECNNEKALYRMSLKKGEQKIFDKYTYKVLSDVFREDIVSLMKVSDPIYWGSRKPEDILIDEYNIPFGIFKNEELLCLTALWKYENIGYITIVATHPDNWNKGYASSLISSVLKELFQENEQCFIMVRIENPSAIHTYEKIGFSICNVHYSYERDE